MPEDQPHRLTGQTAVVTGASRGIGRAIALELAAAGADVLVHTRAREDDLRSVAEEIEQMGRASHVVVADLSEPAARERLVDQAWAWRGRVDIWINNAGADVLTGEAARLSFDEKLERLWQVDVAATVALGRLAGQRMKGQGGGVVLNMGWNQAEWGMAGEAGEMFATTKGAVMAFTRSLARSLAPEVRVNCIAPGWIRTAWAEQASARWQRRAQRESLLGRWGTPDDVARMARALVAPAASFVTGQIIHVGGGYRGSFEEG